MFPSRVTAACLCALLVAAPAEAQDADGGGWVEQPRELPVQQDAAQRTTARTARGGAGTSVAYLLGGLPVAWLAATHGVALAAWVDAQAPAPTGNVQSRGTPATLLPEILRAGVGVAVAGSGVVLTGAVAVAGVVAAGLLVPTAAPVFLPALMVGALLVALGVGVLGVVLSLHAGLAAGALVANLAFQQLWARDAAADPPLTPSPRPLPQARLHDLLAHVALGTLQDTRWKEGIPMVGPWMAASDARERLPTALVEAREIGGMPRVRDTLQRSADLALYGRAALLTLAWAALPLVVLGLAGAGGLVVASALQPVPMGALLIAGVVLLAGVAVVGSVGMMAAAGTAHVVAALTPGYLARRAAGPSEQLPVDERLRAQRRRILPRRPA